jgi:hypothetical protein
MSIVAISSNKTIAFRILLSFFVQQKNKTEALGDAIRLFWFETLGLTVVIHLFLSWPP